MKTSDAPSSGCPPVSGFELFDDESSPHAVANAHNATKNQQTPSFFKVDLAREGFSI
jgi:hypothetical protein